MGETPNDEEAEQAAIVYALKRDVAILAGAGNDGGSVGYPAAYSGVVAVTGTDQNGEFWKSSNKGEQAVLSAPAVQVVTTGGPSNLNGYGIGDGTSDATAFASATAALIKAEHPNLSVGQLLNRMTKTAQLPESEQVTTLPDERYGYGSIRPLAALTEEIPEGNKWGPLSVPRSIKQAEEIAEKKREGQAMQKEADQKAVIIWSVIGVVGLIFIGIIVLTIVLVKRRKKKEANNFGGPGQGL